jgi:DNA-binding transcriptional LysR family regulator
VNLNHLRVFYFAAREGSYTRAADLLFVTQPAVSQTIKSMESYYAVGLFKKSGRSMELTTAGRLLFGYAEQIFTTAEQADTAMRELSTTPQGELHVGTTKIYARYLMPSIIAAFRERFAAVTVVLDEGSSAQMIETVERLENHLAITGRVGAYPPRLRTQHFRHVELTMVAGPDHPFAGRRDVQWSELVGQPLIVREPGSSMRQTIMQNLEHHGVTPTIVMESSSVGFIKEFVAEGRGLGFLFEPDIREELAAGKLVKVPLDGRNIALETDIIMLSEAYKSPMVRAFLGVLEESATAVWSVFPAGDDAEPGAATT